MIPRHNSESLFPHALLSEKGSKYTLFWICVAVVALSAYLLTGIVGLGRTGDAGVDLRFIYVAGQTWLSGEDAYLPADRARASPLLHQDIYAFVYPPWIQPLATTLARLSLPQATHAWEAVNVFCIVGLLLSLRGLAVEQFRNVAGEAGRSAMWATIAFTFALPFASHVSWLGQTSLLATAAVAGACYCLKRQAHFSAGLLLVLASVKPQISFPVMILFMIQGYRKAVGIAIFGIAVASIPALNSSGGDLWELASRWMAELQRYGESHLNSPGFRHMTGFQSLFAVFGLKIPSAVFGIVLIIIVAGLGIQRENSWSRASISLVICGICALVPMHDYDYVLLTIPMANLLLSPKRGSGHMMFILFVITLLYFPQRFVSLLLPDAFLQYRTLCPVLIAAMLIHLRQESVLENREYIDSAREGLHNTRTNVLMP